jgi:GH35 family endo-1,4-beta-xylanase
MLDTFLVPEKTVVTAKGDGDPVDVSAAKNRTFLLMLNISNFVEQESIDVTVWSSADGQTWSAKPLASFPQKFYAGEQPLLLDLSAQPEVKFVRAHWEVNRWGRGPETTMFEFSVRATEVAPELLR